MDSSNIIDTSKPIAHDKNGSIEAHLHGEDKHVEEISEFIESPKSKEDLNAFINAEKSHTNGLLDSHYSNNSNEDEAVSLFQKDNDLSTLVPANIDSFNDKKDFHEDFENSHEKVESFCGNDKLNENINETDFNDDVEEFIPNSDFKENESPQSTLVDVDSSDEPKHEVLESHFAAPPQSKFDEKNNLTSHLKKEDFINADSTSTTNKEVSDLKFSEVNDSSRSGTPDFLELEQDEVKPSVGVAKVPEKLPENVPVQIDRKTEYFHDKPEIGPKEIFSKYGLVEAFIYWRDPKLSAIVFVSGLVLLLSMAYYSLISVIANTGLTILVCAMGFRLYKHVLQAVQKTDQAHPYSVFLDWDLKLPQEKVHELVDTVLIHINAYLGELRRLFLVENWLESIKFAIVLWVLTYVGSWFNGLTLVIIGFVSLFTLPKVYENNKVQIDQNLALVHVKLEELTNKIKDVLPALLRKKLPEKKE